MSKSNHNAPKKRSNGSHKRVAALPNDRASKFTKPKLAQALDKFKEDSFLLYDWNSIRTAESSQYLRNRLDAAFTDGWNAHEESLKTK